MFHCYRARKVPLRIFKIKWEKVTLHLYLQLWATLKQTHYGIFHDVDSPSILSERGLIENCPV